MKRMRVLPLFLAVCAGASVAWAVEPWPGESWSAATNLTYLNPAIWSSNLSGAYWNPQSRRLWLADNSGTFTVLREDGSGGFLKERDYSPGGDLEGITQAEDPGRVYLMDSAEKPRVDLSSLRSRPSFSNRRRPRAAPAAAADPRNGIACRGLCHSRIIFSSRNTTS